MTAIDPTIQEYIHHLRARRYSWERIRAALERQVVYAQEHPEYLQQPDVCVTALRGALGVIRRARQPAERK